MRRRRVLLTVVLVCVCPGAPSATGAEEVLVERKMTREEEALFTITTREEDVSHMPTIEMVKQRYGHVIASPEVVKLILVYDEATRKPQKVKLVVRAVKPVETLYERNLSEEDLKRYALTQIGGLGQGLPIEEIRNRFGAAYWDREWGVQKVEPVFSGALVGQPGTDPYLLVTQLVGRPMKTGAEKKAEAAWIEEAKAKLALGRDAAGLKHLETTFEHCLRLDEEWSGPIPIGRVRETFKGARGVEVVATITEWPGDTVPMHEFLQPVTDRESDAKDAKAGFKPKRTPIGYVLVAELSAPVCSKAAFNWVSVMWVSGNLAIEISSFDSTVAELLGLYGDRFPSTLPRRLGLDKVEWYRVEVDLLLRRLERLAASTELTQVDWFNHNLNELLKRAAVPGLMQNVGLKATPEQRLELYAKASRWWTANRESVVWSEDSGSLAPKNR